MSQTERTLVLLKPDAVQRGLVGAIIQRLERAGLKIVAMKLVQVDQALAQRHYAVHSGKPFYPGLIRFITSSPVVALVLEAPRAVEIVRKLMGETDPARAAPGSVRGDYAIAIGMNLVHGSDAPESARQEIKLFFSADEILEYSRDADRWVQE